MKKIVLFLVFIYISFTVLPESDIHLLEEKLETAKPIERYELLIYLANAYLYDDVTKSIDYCNQALKIALKNDDKNQIVVTYNILASAYSLLGDDITSAVYLEKSLSLQMGYLSPQNSILQQIAEIRRDRAIKELELTNKDLLLSKQRTIQKYYIIIGLLIVVFAGISLNQWQLVAKTNKKLHKTVHELNSANYKLEQISRTDPLTKISNRRDMIEKIEHEKKRFARNGKPFVLIMVDIDNFKQVNDKFGHDAGDFVLESIAHLMQSSVRKQDIIGRWGGEEFLLLLPETDVEGGNSLAEKIRRSVSVTPYMISNKKIPITVTLGVSVYDRPMEFEQCIKVADQALYEGKSKGKNCVVMAQNGTNPDTAKFVKNENGIIEESL
ncbi:MAG: diguanylate cyclase [Candidatus Cloacimonadales bacterium]|nr:diguanylate cyclase [Candidatus Cloacimonadales bacterium]